MKTLRMGVKDKWGGLETCCVSSPRSFLYIEMAGAAGARDRRVSSPLVVIYTLILVDQSLQAYMSHIQQYTILKYRFYQI
jgi:hypothetical protein